MFTDGDCKFESIYTPGHISDHMSFLYQNERILFSGDIVLGTPSTVVADLPAYMDTIYKLKSRLSEFDEIALPHSVKLEEGEDLVVPAKEKLEAYIEYRESRLKQLQAAIEGGAKSKDEMYEALYGDRGLTGKIRDMAWNNLEQQLGYL